jgi:hypothetical protein
VFDTYGNVASKSLDEETSAIQNILQELQGRYAPDMALVGISQWAAELKARKAVDAAFKQICDIINVYMVLEGEANYETFVRTLNEVIGRYKKKHRHHAHHSGNKGGNGGVGAENIQPQPQPQQSQPESNNV